MKRRRERILLYLLQRFASKEKTRGAVISASDERFLDAICWFKQHTERDSRADTRTNQTHLQLCDSVMDQRTPHRKGSFPERGLHSLSSTTSAYQKLGSPAGLNVAVEMRCESHVASVSLSHCLVLFLNLAIIINTHSLSSTQTGAETKHSHCKSW
jgi:hypothetical protein